jgi:hypothetical protein
MFPSPWSPEKQQRQGYIRARMFEEFYVVSDYEQYSGEDVMFRGHGVYSWDPATEEYVMYWFDTMGGAGGVARGPLVGNVLTFANQTPMGHQRYRYTFNDGETIFEIFTSPDGNEWQTLMKATYRPA